MLFISVTPHETLTEDQVNAFAVYFTECEEHFILESWENTDGCTYLVFRAPDDSEFDLDNLYGSIKEAFNSCHLSWRRAYISIWSSLSF